MNGEGVCPLGRTRAQGRASREASTTIRVTGVPKGPCSYLPFLEEKSALWFISVHVRDVLIIIIIDRSFLLL